MTCQPETENRTQPTYGKICKLIRGNLKSFTASELKEFTPFWTRRDKQVSNNHKNPRCLLGLKQCMIAIRSVLIRAQSEWVSTYSGRSMCVSKAFCKVAAEPGEAAQLRVYLRYTVPLPWCTKVGVWVWVCGIRARHKPVAWTHRKFLKVIDYFWHLLK